MPSAGPRRIANTISSTSPTARQAWSAIWQLTTATGLAPLNPSAVVSQLAPEGAMLQSTEQRVELGEMRAMRCHCTINSIGVLSELPLLLPWRDFNGKFL